MSIEQAKHEFYKNENCSCILYKDGKTVFKSFDMGIRPLLEAVPFMRGAVVADKIIGRAAALLCVYGGAAAVYGHIMSGAAQKLFDDNNIAHGCFKTTERIMNKKGNDICPMEKLVSQTDSPQTAFELITEKLTNSTLGGGQ